MRLILFPLLLLLFAAKNDTGALQRYREVTVYSSRVQRRQIQSTYIILNGRRYDVKKHCVSSIDDTRNWNQEISSKRRISKKTRDNQGSRNHRKPIFLDASKRKAFREFHRST